MTQPPVAVACFCSMPRAPAAKNLAARNTALYWKWYFQVTSSRFERRVQDKMQRHVKRIIPHSNRPYGHSLPSYAAGNTSRRLVACLYWRISLPFALPAADRPVNNKHDSKELGALGKGRIWNGGFGEMLA